MSIEQHQCEPTALECAHYFSSLPSLETDWRVHAPRAIVLNDGEDSGIDTDSLAEINTDQPAVIAFADNVSEENREAIMLGVEFAETVASKLVDVDIDPINYLKEYAKAFRKAGWTLQGSDADDDLSKYKSTEMDSLVVEILSSIAGPNAPAVLKLMNLTLEKLQGNGPLMKLFENNAKKSKKTTFRMIPCLQSRAGTPVTYMLAMDVQSSTHTGGALFWKWKVSNLSIQKLAKGVQFSRATYDRNEAAILEYLGADADAFFEGLPK